jgi:uncharacterized DUF497 family protein
MKFVGFEWDESKNQSNIKKHGVSFEEARSVFYDEQAVEFYDIEHAGKEERFFIRNEQKAKSSYGLPLLKAKRYGYKNYFGQKSH